MKEDSKKEKTNRKPKTKNKSTELFILILRDTKLTYLLH